MSLTEYQARDEPPQLADLPHVEVAGNVLVLFTESPPLVAAMVHDVRSARRRVWLESYIIADDAAGLELADALLERAAEGLDVRVIYDAVGSVGTSKAYFERLAAGGVQVHAFRTLWSTVWRRRFLTAFNRRDHRKLLIIDDDVAYFGGMNVVDQRGIHSVADAKARHLPASAGWRDVHVRLTGDKQPEIAAAFDRLWKREHRRSRTGAPWPIARLAEREGEAILTFDCRPTFRHRRPARVFVPLIVQAEREITVSMAYFIPVGRVLRALVRARGRGVRIRVVLPGVSDVRLVQWAARHFYQYLLRHGIEIYERRDTMLHSKVMVIDDLWSLVGSCNLDPRSLRLNLEFLAAIRSQEMAKAVKQICVYEIDNSDPVTLDKWHRRRWWQFLLDRIAWSLRWWL